MAKGLTAAELRNKLEDELVQELREKKEELFNLRFQAATGQLESHGRLRAVRREIARIYTVMRERELGFYEVIEEAAEAAEAAGTDTEQPADTSDTAEAADPADTIDTADTADAAKSDKGGETAKTASVKGGSDD
jgi:large subunit ribosomal protein L29